ncbi:MAG: biopolymer transporter ExbD [Bacteroidetes bacterium]|nr:biopolymer transporter ExbD [Bacteroidota bacterium]
MAEIIINNRNAHTKNKIPRSGLKIDLTPMVDLGFLLITFFIFTTTISENKVLNLVMPKDSADSTLIKKSGALILLPAGSDRFYYYYGGSKSIIGPVDMNRTQDILLEKRSKILQKDFFVIIKPLAEANYSQIVRILNEIKINDVVHYAIVNPDSGDLNNISAQ